jgi:hypothetical protein
MPVAVWRDAVPDCVSALAWQPAEDNPSLPAGTEKRQMA